MSTLRQGLSHCQSAPNLPGKFEPTLNSSRSQHALEKLISEDQTWQKLDDLYMLDKPHKKQKSSKIGLKIDEIIQSKKQNEVKKENQRMVP